MDMMSPPKAGIFGLAGPTISEEEKQLFQKVNPLGFILFARNCITPVQVNGLVRALKDLLDRDDVLILIDQEGGRVSRLKPPGWRERPAAGKFAQMAAHSVEEAKAAVYANTRLIALDLWALGINVDCAPLADLPVEGAHDIIGDRAFGRDAKQVITLAAEMARGLLEGGVLPVLKHLPGHGRACSDSHEELPVVNESLDVLRATDFVPFKALAHIPLGMTAHILYTAIDDERPATLSPKVLKLVREEIGFDGLLMSDDLSMKALKGDFGERTRGSLAAGCDIVLHCNGKMEEMQSVADALPVLAGKGLARVEKAWAQLKPPTHFDYGAAENLLYEKLAG